VVVSVVVGVTVWSAGPVAAASPPPMTAERRLSPNVYVHQEEPAIASDGTNHLAVWTDDRDGVEIYGTRLGKNGKVLDPDGIRISDSGDDLSRRPAVVFDGTNYLVVWEKLTGPDEADIVGARVATDGHVVDATPIVFSDAAHAQRDPHLASDGQTVLVVWGDGRANGASDVYATRWTEAGGVLDPDGIALATGAASQSAPAVVAYGPAFLVSWYDNEFGLMTGRVEAGGDVLDPGGDPLFAEDSIEREDVDLAFDGTNVMIVYTSRASGEPAYVYGARWSPISGLLDPDGFQISNGSIGAFNPKVVFNRIFLVAWEDNRNNIRRMDVYGARVKTNGTVQDPEGFAIAGSDKYDYQPALDATSEGRWIATYFHDGAVKYRLVSPK
jgi:hypothetical protein